MLQLKILKQISNSNNQLIYNNLYETWRENSIATINEIEQKIYIKKDVSSENPLSLVEISTKFYLTKERVRQIRDKAIPCTRLTSKRKNLRVFLG